MEKNIITEWLEANGDPKISEKIEQDLAMRNSIHKLINLYYDIEEKSLLEKLSTEFDDNIIDFNNIADQDLYDFCIANDVEHIWLDWFVLLKFTNNS